MDKNLINHVKEVIDLTLVHLGNTNPAMDSKSARVLLLGTAMIESACKYKRQIGGGPARGLWQVEKATFYDNKDNYLAYRHDLEDAFLSMTAETPYGHIQLSSNDMLACAHARIKYYRAPGRLPSHNNAKMLADYHKKFYNTMSGKTDVDDSVLLFEEAIKHYS